MTYEQREHLRARRRQMAAFDALPEPVRDFVAGMLGAPDLTGVLAVWERAMASEGHDPRAAAPLARLIVEQLQEMEEGTIACLALDYELETGHVLPHVAAEATLLRPDIIRGF